ncbi:hypothetical protein GW17_00060956, partial [Ensete ventricosum]
MNQVIFSDFDAFESDSSTESLIEDGDETEGAFTETEEFFEAEEIFTNADWQNVNRDTEATTFRNATSVDDGNSIVEICNLTGQARSRFETSKAEEDSETRVSQKLTDTDGKYIMIETCSLHGPAKTSSESDKCEHDDEFVMVKSVTSECMVQIEEKKMIECSTLQQDKKGTATSLGEENDLMKINNLKQETETVTSLVNMTHNFVGTEAPDTTESKWGNGDHKHGSENISETTSNSIGEIPSLAKHIHERETDSSTYQDKVEHYSESMLRIPGVTKETITKFPTIACSSSGKIISKESTYMDYTVTCEEKNIVEVSNSEHEVKDIVALDVEEKNIAETYNIEQDATGLASEKKMSSCAMTCKTQILTSTHDADNRPEKIKSRFNQENITTRKTLLDKGHNQGNQGISPEVKFECKREPDKVVAQSKTQPKILNQKFGNGEEKQTLEISLYTMPEKPSSGTKLPDSLVSKTMVKQQESAADQQSSRQPKTVARWISPGKDSDATSVHLPSHPPS